MSIQHVSVDPGKAPELDELPRDTARKPPATSRPLWLTAYLLVIVVMILRVPQVYDYLGERVPAEMSAGINDKDMEALALKTGVFLALVLTALIVALYFSLAAVLEKKIFTVGRTIRGNLSFGLFFLVITLSTLPVQIAGLVLDIPNLRGNMLYYVYILAVGLLSPWVYHRTWKGMPARKLIILFTASTVVALLTVIG
jgi:hypothetical protein